MTTQRKWRSEWTPEKSIGFVAEWVTTHQPDDGRVLWVDFTIWSVAGHDVPAHSGPGAALYQRKGSDNSCDFVETTDEAEPLVSGYLKWDGCNEVNWTDDGVHMCGLADRDRQHTALAMVLRTAAIAFMVETYTIDKIPPGDALKPGEVV